MNEWRLDIVNSTKLLSLFSLSPNNIQQIFWQKRSMCVCALPLPLLCVRRVQQMQLEHSASSLSCWPWLEYGIHLLPSRSLFTSAKLFFLFCSDNFAIIQVEHERTRKLLVIVLCNSFENGKGIILAMICRNELLLLEKKNQAIKWKCEMSRKKKIIPLHFYCYSTSIHGEIL